MIIVGGEEVGWCKLKPVGPRVAGACLLRLKLQCDELRSSLAVDSNLRHYEEVLEGRLEKPAVSIFMKACGVAGCTPEAGTYR